MDDPKRSLITFALVAALVGGGFLAFELFDEPAPPDEGAADTAAPRDAGLSEAEREARKAKAKTFVLETEHVRATFTNLNASLTSLEVKGERFQNEEGHQEQLVSTDKEDYYPLRAEIRGLTIPKDAVWTGVQESPTAVRFEWKTGPWTVVRRFESGETPYQIWSTTRVHNGSDAERDIGLRVGTYHYVPREQEEGGFLGRPSTALAHGICRLPDETVREDHEELQEEPQTLGPSVRWVGVENTYFAWLLAPSDNSGKVRCVLRASDRGQPEPVGSLFESELLYEKQALAPNKDVTYRTLAYVGPKDWDALEASGHSLSEVVDLGFFSFIGRGLLQLLRWIHGFVGNWGLAIVLLTALVKLLLFPLSHKSFQSMARMRVLKPEMDRINELYADDREKKGAAMMELYKKHKINPVGGCLPMLLQIPIFFALYQSLSTNVELYHAPFALWWGDLSSPDPYYVLPLIIGALMFLQQRLTPTTMDATQAKVMMYMMPVMVTAFMLFLPAGLCVYMVTNSALGIAQQRYIHWRADQESAQEAAPSDPDSAEPDDGEPSSAKSPTRNKPRGKKRQRRGRA